MGSTVSARILAFMKRRSVPKKILDLYMSLANEVLGWQQQCTICSSAVAKNRARKKRKAQVLPSIATACARYPGKPQDRAGRVAPRRLERLPGLQHRFLAVLPYVAFVQQCAARG
jgi:hypothetical protein